MLSITTTLKGSVPTKTLPFERIADHVLGRTYEVSVAFVGRTRSRTLNRTYRGKDHATNVLSFPLSKKSGELILCKPIIDTEHTKFGRTKREHMLMLFIHGLLHLKGLDHGSTMDGEERRIAKRFGYVE